MPSAQVLRNWLAGVVCAPWCGSSARLGRQTRSSRPGHQVATWLRTTVCSGLVCSWRNAGSAEIDAATWMLEPLLFSRGSRRAAHSKLVRSRLSRFGASSRKLSLSDAHHAHAHAHAHGHQERVVPIHSGRSIRVTQVTKPNKPPELRSRRREALANNAGFGWKRSRHVCDDKPIPTATGLGQAGIGRLVHPLEPTVSLEELLSIK